MGIVEPLVFLSGVVMGTGSTITIKVIYGLEAIGLSGHHQRFEKPLTTTWIMFVAMMLALPAFWIKRYYQQYQRNKYMQKKLGSSEHQPILGIKSSTPYEEYEDEYYVEQDVPWKTYFLLVIPAVFDLLGTALSSIGLLFTTVSVYQLLRCSVIIVTAILKTTVLGHKLTKYMWMGIFINTVAMVMVALTSYIDPVAASGDATNDAKMVETESRDPAVGIMFILLSCIVQGSQYVFEEKVMAVDNAPPLVVVGMEGVWGTLLMPLVVFPWAYILPGSDVDGCFENVLDAYVMLQHSSSIQIILAIFTFTVFLYNIFCIYVTYLLDSVWHSILDNFRPVSVWGTDLLLFYVITGGEFGESWGNGSWLQLAGLILLFLGTAVYNSTIKLPYFDYTAYEDDEVEDEHLGIPVQQAMSSPYLARSPLLTFRSLTPKQGSMPSSRNTGAYGSVGAGPTNWPSYGSGLLSSPLNGSNGFGGGSSYPSARSGR